MNLHEDHPTVFLGPREEDEKNEEVPHLYVSLNIHDMTLHNTMLDSWASHNLIPKVIMERWGLDITRPYKDLFYFDSKRVKCISLIKDVVVALCQIPTKTILMDIIVAHIPPKFGMFLSRSWVSKVKGTIQMDMSYTTIPVFGEQRRLYKESRMAYMFNNEDKPQKFPVYAMEIELGSSILFNEITNNTKNQCVEKKQKVEEIDRKGWWHMSFDGTAGRDGVGAGISIISLGDESMFFSYKLNFDCKNNMAGYETLVLGLEVLKNLGAKKIFVFGDSELE